MNLNPIHKMCKDPITNEIRMEKYFLRKAFDTPENPFLPDNVLWRQKEQFSDGVGYNWIDSLKEVVEREVSDTDMEVVHHRFPTQPPRTKEEYYYRSIFEEHFPSDTAALTVPSVPSVACSTPTALAWDASFQNMNEPSGRAIGAVHNDAY